MALKPLNSVGGFSIGELPVNVIHANGYITANGALYTGNVAVSNSNPLWGIITDNIYYSNGSPWIAAAGSNNQVQYKIGNSLAASANFTYNDTTQTLTVIGNISVPVLKNGNSNITLTPNGNISLNISGTSNVLIASSNAVTITGNANIIGTGRFQSVVSNTVTSVSGNVNLNASSGNNYVVLTPTGTGQVSVQNFRIENLVDPINDQDAATKIYVDTVAQGLHIKTPVEVATNNTLAVLSSGVVTYNNGTLGVGATLTTTGTFTLIDGVNIASAGTRILVKDEANPAHNGIYVYSSSTILTRASDYDVVSEIKPGDYVFINQGNTYSGQAWVQIDTVTLVGTSPIVWQQFSGQGTYVGGGGIDVTGTVISANVDNVTTAIQSGNIVVKAGAQLDTPNIGTATGTTLSLSGNVLAANVNANILVTSSNITATNTMTTSNLAVSNNANFSSNVIANKITSNTNILIGNTNIGWGSVTTYSITANQTIAQFSVAGITGIEFIVKGSDVSGSKYSVATVTALTDGFNIDYVTYATANLGGITGILAVNKTGSNIALQVTPMSANSTLWTAQYRIL